MLVSLSVDQKSNVLLTSVHVQLNTLDVPATMTFNLTESPWIRAGRQYHIRVSVRRFGCDTRVEIVARISGRIVTMELPSGISRLKTYLLMVLLRYC